MTAPAYATLWPIVKLCFGLLGAVVVAEAAFRIIVRRSEGRR